MEKFLLASVLLSPFRDGESVSYVHFSVMIAFSSNWSVAAAAKSLSLFSRVRLLATPWTAAYEAPPSMGFSRQEYWSGVPLPSPGLVVSYI